MKTKPPHTDLPSTTRPTGIESVKFNDGMIVTAEDLDAAMRYPASMLHTVLRSYFGCGVVCGLELKVKEAPGKRPNWVVCLERGVAIDCQGYPIELCAPIEIDLSPPECACEPPPAEICIAIKRTTSDEAAPDLCGCDLDGPHYECRRVQDHIMIKAFSAAEFEALPSTCRRETVDDRIKDKAKKGDDDVKDRSDRWSRCSCLTECPPRDCDDCWILLGCVDIHQDPPEKDNRREGIDGDPDSSGRRWVKPTECQCGPKAAAIEEKLLGRLVEVEQQLKDLTEKKTTAAE